MILMIMGDQNKVNARQMLELQAWFHEPLVTGKPDRARSSRPMWVGENIENVKLDKECGMTDPRDRRRCIIGPQERAIVLHWSQRTAAWMNRRSPRLSRYESYPFHALGSINSGLMFLYPCPCLWPSGLIGSSIDSL